MKVFKNSDEPSVGVDIGRFSLLVWYGSVLQWGLWLHKERSSEKTQWDLALGPLNFYWWTD